MATSDWSFARKPFWLFSHVLVIGIFIAFVNFGFWQLGRHRDQGELNELIESRANPPAALLSEVLGDDPSDLDYQFVRGSGAYLDGEAVQVTNRAQGSVAGFHSVGLFQLDDGRRLLVNRGFVPDDPSSPVQVAPTGQTEIEGWLRLSIEYAGLGPVDPGEGKQVPRLDIDAIAGRFDDPIEPVWLQLAPADSNGNGTGDGAGEGARPEVFPDPIPLPELTSGSHLGYMIQWWSFAALGVVFYGALLRSQSRDAPSVETDSPSMS